MYRQDIVHPALARLALGLLALCVPCSAMSQTPSSTGATSLTAGFNGTPIAAGSYLWFNSVLKVKLPSGTSQPVNIYLDSAALTVTPRGGTPTPYAVPSATITYVPGATTATTTYDPLSGRMVTMVPASFGDNVFLSGL